MARSSFTAALVGWFALSATLSAAPVAKADDAEATVAAQSAALAERVLEVTDGKSVQIGQFAPVGLSGANFGPGLEEALRAALDAKQARLTRDGAVFEVKGSYAFAKTRDPRFADRKVIKVTAEVVDLEFAETVAEIPLRIDADAEIAEAIGVSGQLATADAGSPADLSKQRATLEELAANPTVSVQNGVRVLPAAGSPLSVEALAGPSLDRLSPRPVTVQHGQAFINLKTGEVCQLRIRNDSNQEVAVKASLDGLNSFHFADKALRRPDGTLSVGPHYVFKPGQTGEIPGWFLRLNGPNNYQAFSVVEYGAGAASSQGRDATGRIGVLHVQFSHVASPGKSTARSGGTKSFDQEIGRGEEFTAKQGTVEREVLPPFAFVTIRYDRPQ